MKQTRALVIVLGLVCVACDSHSSGSELDQYEAHDSRPHRQLLRAKATDQPLNVHVPHRFGFVKKLKSHADTQSSVPELQVGCEEGFTDSRAEQIKKLEVISSKKLRTKRQAERRRRDYFRVSGRTPPLTSYNTWQPSVIQIRRPYYIPVWGPPGSIPLYFPPQPLLVNPGYPPDNPKKSYFPPKGYLPPDNKDKNGKEDKPEFSDRFITTEEDRPIWEGGQASFQPTTPIIPTRRTRRPGERSTHPPLVHRPNRFEEDEFINLAVAAPTQAPPARAITASPPVRSTTAAPGPSRCTWAIISCCSAASEKNVSYNCFEQLGCAGAFWDNSPCESAYARAAIESAMKYYETQN